MSRRTESTVVPRPNGIALMVTRRCNMSCAHCSVESRPGIRKQPDEAQLMQWVRESADAGVGSVLFTGGEPMLRQKIVLRLMMECKRLGVTSAMTTNGFWGTTLVSARRRLKWLRRAGLQRLTVSFDSYHAEFQGPEPALHIAQAADEVNFLLHVSVTRVANDPELEQLVAPFRDRPNVRLRFYDVQPIGNAAKLPLESLRSEVEGFCSACDSPAITDDGRVTACNGPAYFTRPGSPLSVGSLQENTVGELVQRHQEDPVLDTIRTSGPARLRDELKSIAGFEDFPFREHYHGMCDLCLDITSNEKAVTALRKKLGEPGPTAQRVAIRKVIDDHRQNGLLNRDYVNGIGACRTFLHAATNPSARWTPEFDKILGRADLDWNHLQEYLNACGLARQLLPALDDDGLNRWAPSFFTDQIKKRSVQDGMLELVQRETLRRISRVLCEMGAEGILLKGAAAMALHAERVFGGSPAASCDTSERGVGAAVPRATGDIDVYIEPDSAQIVRDRLLANGFEGSQEAKRTGPHHLAPVTFQGVPVEIHTGIMPGFWGLPEREMLALTKPVEHEDFVGLKTLTGEGMLLHSGVHSTAHLFSTGLKTAWDLLSIPQLFPAIDWDRIKVWIAASRIPRAFWVPVHVLSEEMEIPVPLEFLRHAPTDNKQRKLELIARHQLFQSVDGPFELNAISKNGVFLLMHGSWPSQLRYLASLGSPGLRESRRSARGRNDLRGTQRLSVQIGEALEHWRQFRRATSRHI